MVFDETTVWPDGFDFSYLRPVRPRSFPPLCPRTYKAFAVQEATAENDPPAK
ncbi:hypothetical protein AB0G15_37290 [Streptosporangium sp. NPDC023825]|uniref:hypothetical protein n=1 Tax=Streptosporangium sp. NPDC023825 TaxID=3154909 RepID=UPI00342EFF7F